MKVLAFGAITGDPRPYVDDEIRRVAELRASGVIEQLYFTEGTPGIVIILVAAAVAAAERELATLPMVEGGVLAFELTGLRPTPPGR